VVCIFIISFPNLWVLNSTNRDAGITLSCQMIALADPGSSLAKALLPSTPNAHLNVLELGTGCGMVGIAIAQTISNSKVLLTDLPEAREIVERNIESAVKAPDASLAFLELDWDAELPDGLKSTSEPLDLVVAADCTYNPDSRYDHFLHHTNAWNTSDLHLQPSFSKHSSTTSQSKPRGHHCHRDEDAPLQRRSLLRPHERRGIFAQDKDGVSVARRCTRRRGDCVLAHLQGCCKVDSLHVSYGTDPRTRPIKFTSAS
jgi:hypothetical protein